MSDRTSVGWMPRPPPVEEAVAQDRRPGWAAPCNPATDSDADASTDLHIGELVGGTYEVQSRIAVGGMGCIYLAEDRVLHRSVAIKTSLPGVRPETLLHEAQILAAFRHPGLPAIYTFGTHRGIECLVMERIPGVTLARHLDDQRPVPPPIEDAIDLLLAIAEPLAVLHEAGLAHRDLKPENIMLAGHGRVVLLDFGITREERAMEGEKSISGSPMHMAPESLRAMVRPGEAHLVDLYALAVVAFELTTLHAPFPNRPLVELLCRHELAPAPRVSSVRPEVPAALDDLVARMLEKDPTDRPPSVDIVIDELARMRGRTPRRTREAPSKPATIPAGGAVWPERDPRPPGHAQCGVSTETIPIESPDYAPPQR